MIKFESKQHGKNVHEITFFDTREATIAQLSDIHWDNPKTDWDYLKKTLNYCKERNIPIVVNGDFFCLMQGRGDRRSNKSDIRPEHNNAKYLDSIVETAVDFWKPYAHLLVVCGYGNHETAIIKWQETDILRRFVDLLNYQCKTNIQVGGYGGWIVYRIDYHGRVSTFKHRYFHGSGGGGIVTKGTINLTRATEMYDGFDIFSMGHIHENLAIDVCMNTLDYHTKKGYFTTNKNVHMMITGTFKEEYQDGSKGWHIERGAPPKPIGGRLLKISMQRDYKDGKDVEHKHIDSMKFPFSY